MHGRCQGDGVGVVKMFTKGAISEEHKGALQCGKPLWPQGQGSRLSLGSAWWRGDLYGCPRSARGALQNGKMCAFGSKRLGVKGVVGG